MTSRASMATNARYRQLAHERNVGVWADPEIIRARVRSEAVTCPACGEMVHPDNWQKHLALDHPGETVPYPAKDALTTDEQTALERCESIIKAELDAFVRVGLALAEINASRLYRANYATFEAYVQERWGLKRSAAYDLMKTAQTAALLSEHLDTPLEYASHARALNGLAPEDAALVVNLVKATAPGGNVTTRHLKSLACVVGEIMQTGAVLNADGVSIPAREATFDEIRAAVTETHYESIKRQEGYMDEYIKAKGTPRHYAYKAAQMATSRGGEMVITGLEPGKTYRVSVWVDGEIS